MQPVFIDHENRQFLNPISYIGGPRLDNNGRLMNNNRSNRNSIDSITSILSIDWNPEMVSVCYKYIYKCKRKETKKYLLP